MKNNNKIKMGVTRAARAARVSKRILCNTGAAFCAAIRWRVNMSILDNQEKAQEALEKVVELCSKFDDPEFYK